MNSTLLRVEDALARKVGNENITLATKHEGAYWPDFVILKKKKKPQQICQDINFRAVLSTALGKINKLLFCWSSISTTPSQRDVLAAD